MFVNKYVLILLKSYCLNLKLKLTNNLNLDSDVIKYTEACKIFVFDY